MATSVFRVPKHEVERYILGRSVPWPIIAYAAVDEDGVYVGMGGLSWTEYGCVLWLSHTDPNRPKPFAVVRWAKRLLRMARQLGENEVFVWHDAEHANSLKLLRLLGFELVGREKDKDRYRWLASKPSPLSLELPDQQSAPMDQSSKGKP